MPTAISAGEKALDIIIGREKGIKGEPE